MMPNVLPRSWKEDFAAAVAEKREDMIWKEKIAISQWRERERRAEDEADEAQDNEATSELLAFVLATEQETALFRVQLDDYDTKTVEALMDNQEARLLLRRHIDDLLEHAYVMPDGRRVFKTRDGQQVFDENGIELLPSVIDPDAIEDTRPDWETFEAAMKERQRLDEEHKDLLDYQGKLDIARDRLDKGDITKKDLEDLKGDLSAAMPEAVRAKLDLDQPHSKESDPAMDQKAPVPDDLGAALRHTGVLSAGPAVR